MTGNIVINQVAILFLIMIVGFAARKTDIINRETRKKLSEMLVRITLPAMIIYSYNQEFSPELLQNGKIMIIYSFAIHLVSIFLAGILFRKYPKKTGDILKFITIYTNCGYMGLPILEALYGKTGIFYASMYITAFNIFTWTNGVMIFTGQKDLKAYKKALLNPGIVAVVIGMIIFIYQIKLPFPVLKTAEILGAMTTPLSMLIIGSLIADVRPDQLLKGRELYYAAFIRLILIPTAVLIILKIIGITDNILLGACVTTVAMPAAANTAVFSERYNGDSAFGSRAVAFTTILSMVTIPALLYFI